LSGDPQQEKAEDRDTEDRRHLGWRDYLALMVASLETLLLPLIILVIVLLALVLALR
jgi:hypothetical protein